MLQDSSCTVFAAWRAGGLVAFAVYMITTFSLYVPDWSFVASEDDKSERFTVKRSKNFSTTLILYYNQEKWMRLNTEFQVQCGMRGHLGPACNAVGYVDRQFWGINHLYTQPVWSRLKVRSYPSSVSAREKKKVLLYFKFYDSWLCMQACTFSSPDSGPFREDAPTWCRAPFEPEGLLRSLFLFPSLWKEASHKDVRFLQNRTFLQLDFSHCYRYYRHPLWTCVDSFQGKNHFHENQFQIFGYESHIMKSGSCSKAQTLGINGSSATDHSLCPSFHRWYIRIH